jgi:PIN domain nuclease of toxin-antitoxin system
VRLLLDTHALIWWLAGDPSLSANAKAAMIDPESEVFVSAASAWEIATKYRIGRLPQAAALALDVPGALASQGFIELPITCCTDKRPAAFPVHIAIRSTEC